MASFTQQQLNWRACDQAFLGEELWKELGDEFEPLGQRAQCALMRAPLDYANPASGELQVAVSRVVAEQPQQRQGAIFFNPGGPGADGLERGAHFAGQVRERDVNDPVSQQLRQMSERYDLIGFSPRGVGAGTRLHCEAPPPVDQVAVHDHSLQGLMELHEQQRLLFKACSENPLSRHIHTEATARDMELMRVVLGYEKFNYIGVSYGTILGTWYASLFPERVGRMLLDGSTGFLTDFNHRSTLQQMGKQRVLDEIFLPYATRHPQLFNLGESVTALRSALEELPPKLKVLLFQCGEAIDWSDPRHIHASLASINAALNLQNVLRQHPTARLYDFYKAVLEWRYAPDEPFNTAATLSAYKMATQWFAAPNLSTMKMSGGLAVKASIFCNDRSNAQDLSDAGPGSAAVLCADWPKSDVQPPSMAAAQKAGPLLMLQSRYDALTPIEGAQKLLDALPNASMIVVENEFQHGVFPYGDQCVDAQVANYFLHGTMPQRLSSCAGMPLETYGGWDKEGEDD